RAFFDRVLTSETNEAPLLRARPYRVGTPVQVDESMYDLIGPYLHEAQHLGQTTARVHKALASRREPKSFAPESFSTMHQQSIYAWTRGLMARTCEALRKKQSRLPTEVRASVGKLVQREREIESLLKRVKSTKLEAVRIRCHGDLHLGQVLYT